MQLTFDRNVPSTTGRVAIFASYDGRGIVRDYVLYYLSELKKEVDAIVFVADNAPASEEEVMKLKDLVVYASFVRHQSYDFGSYRLGYLWAREHGLLDSAEEVIFCNDSCYGPVFPFSTVFDRMAGCSCDFWGLSGNPEIRYHIQSFFMVFRRIWIRASACKWQSLQQTIDTEMRNVDASFDSEYLIYRQRLKHIILLVWISLWELLIILILLCL